MSLRSVHACLHYSRLQAPSPSHLRPRFPTDPYGQEALACSGAQSKLQCEPSFPTGAALRCPRDRSEALEWVRDFWGGNRLGKKRKPITARKPPVPSDSHAEIADWITRGVMPDMHPIVERLDESIRETIPGLQ
jgi:hypothetical protein